MVKELLAHLMLTVPDFENNPVVESVHRNAAEVEKEVDDLVSINTKLASNI